MIFSCKDANVFQFLAAFFKVFKNYSAHLQQIKWRAERIKELTKRFIFSKHHYYAKKTESVQLWMKVSDPFVQS